MTKLNDAYDQIGILSKSIYNVFSYGAVGDGVTDDTTAIQNAINAANNAGGGIVQLPGKTYKTTATLTSYNGIDIVGAGMGVTTINYTGTGKAIEIATNVDTTKRAGLKNLTIAGTSAAGAIGLCLTDTYGFCIERVKIQNFTGGVGLQLENVNYWTEGTITNELHLNNNSVGVRFVRQNTTNATNSFAYTHMFNVEMNVPASGIGIDFGGTTGNAIYLYHCIINATIWLDSSSSAIAVQGRTGCLIEKSKLFIGGEGSGTGQQGLILGGATIKGEGFFRITGSTNDLSSGSIRLITLDGQQVLDNMSGTDGSSNVYKTLVTENVDVSHMASFGYYTGSNVDSPFATMYDNAGNGFRIIAVPYNQSISQGHVVALVNNLGALFPQAQNTTSSNALGIYAGTVNPNGNVYANAGSIYIHTSGQIYIKTTGTNLSDNTNWNAIQQVNGGTTAQRPASPFYYTMYFDTTLGKPIWYNGSAWKDATGATV